MKTRKTRKTTRVGGAVATLLTVAALATACDPDTETPRREPAEARPTATARPTRTPWPPVRQLPVAPTRRSPARRVADTGATAAKVTYLRSYAYCGGWDVSHAQRCIDRGKLTWYKPSGVNTLAGHNYRGWYWVDDLPTGRTVRITTGALKGTYRVYGHAKVYDGRFPRSGLGAAVALQTCEGRGIGFSFLRRV